jgi:hypothetical protein
MLPQNRFEREFFRCAGSVLATRWELTNWTDGILPDGGQYDKIAVFVGELSYGAEMSLLARERKREILGDVAQRVFGEKD